MSISLHGVGVAAGIAIGRAHVSSPTEINVPHYTILASEVDAEQHRYETAIRNARRDLEELWNSIPENAPAELGAFLSLHVMILNDHTLSKDPQILIESQLCNAEWALKVQRDLLVAQFDEIEEAYLRERRADLIQVADRIFKALAGQATTIAKPLDDQQDHILVAHDLSPADMLLFKDGQFGAFITDVGGTTSHTAILARSLGIPSVLALHNASQVVRNKDVIIVDGAQGVVIISPDDRVLEEYRQRKERWLAEKQLLESIKTAVPLTRDDVRVELLANIELPSDIVQVKANGADGIGLFRSEFLFLGRDSLPSEEEQFQAYREVVEGMEGLPVVIRTLDLGHDKNAKWATHGFSSNPALGLCGIRLCLAEPGIFRAQLRALLRASYYGRLEILIPMLSSIPELEQALMHIKLTKKGLEAEGIPYDPNVRIGGMIEVPSAAITAAQFAKRLDFLSIGTNDLIQYTLAIDRTDDAVAHLYDPLHPAVLSLIHMTLQAGEKAGIPVSVCGEMGGNVMFTRILMGLGLRKFSMPAARMLTVKRSILDSDLATCEKAALKILKTDDAEVRTALLDELNFNVSP